MASFFSREDQANYVLIPHFLDEKYTGFNLLEFLNKREDVRFIFVDIQYLFKRFIIFLNINSTTNLFQ